ncbi:MAG: hypothetical protein U1F11_13310 [Steroidobacteraceae bacterium]
MAPGATGAGREAAELASVALAGGRITVGTPAALRERFGAALEGVPVGRFAAVGIRVCDLAATARLLAGRGVPCERRAGALVVPAAGLRRGGGVLGLIGRGRSCILRGSRRDDEIPVFPDG